MTRLPFPDYNTQSYYVRSYAALPPSTRCQFCSTCQDKYSYSQGGTVGTGSTCAAAMAAWDRNYKLNHKGPPPPDMSGTDAITQGIQGVQKTVGGGVAAIGAGASAVGSGITNSVLGESHAIQQGFSDATNSTGQFFGNIEKGISDAFSHAGQNAGDAWTSFVKFFQDGFGTFGTYFPYIAVGGAAILLILLIKK